MNEKAEQPDKPKQDPPKDQQYPEPDQIEKLFEAWQKGGKGGLVDALKKKKE